SLRRRSTLSYFFFFQAEDGIRDFHVTGVQTCALPISSTFTCSQYGLLSVSVEVPPDLDENIEHPASSKIPTIEQKRITSDPLIKPKPASRRHTAPGACRSPPARRRV